MLFICAMPAKANKHTTADAASLDACLLQVAQGHTDALETLYHETSASVYSLALSILKNAQDAQDVLHDCYISIYSAAESYRANSKPMAWIMTIARNLCPQKLRQRSRLADLPTEDWACYLEENHALPPEEKLLLARCMARLSDTERQVVVLHAVAGFKHREIAQMLDLSLPAVLSKYNRALKKLQTQL